MNQMDFDDMPPEIDPDMEMEDLAMDDYEEMQQHEEDPQIPDMMDGKVIHIVL